ncbi:MAG TPA: GntR family transcriptional regulator [Jatrophihabitantaceae bacterium]|nr:GntR family transcriptional regulator [Jatrophihabitantaceae bacterium]
MSSAVAGEVPRAPKYYLVKQHLLERIEKLPPGAPVPTERVLTAELGTSRTTVRQALAELVGEGRLVRRQGSGTFVAEPKISWPLQLTSFTEQAAESCFAVSTELLEAERVRASADVAAKLRLDGTASVFRVERLRSVGDQPMAVETSYLSARRFPGLVAELRRAGSLYKVMSDVYGVRPVSAEETIETASASPREAGLLQVDTGSPILVLGRHSFDADGEPLEWVRSWYRGDRYTFVARLTLEQPHG